MLAFLQVSSMKTRRPGSPWLCRFVHCMRRRAMSGWSPALATTVFFKAELLGVDEVPHRVVIDFEAVLGEFAHQPAQREPSFPDASRHKDLMIASNRLRLMPAHLARRHAARVLEPPDPNDDRADPNAEHGCRPMPRQSALHNRRNHGHLNKAFPSMLASSSTLNQNKPDSGIPAQFKPKSPARIDRTRVCSPCSR